MALTLTRSPKTGSYYARNIDPAADRDTQLAATRFNFKISRARVRYGDEGNFRIYDAKHVLFRGDDKTPLGIVSPTYKIVQPATVFDSMLAFAEAGHGTMHRADVFNGGANYFALVKTETDPIIGTVGRGDVIESYIGMRSSADGSSATEAYHLTLRLVCLNGMRSMGSRTLLRVNHRSTFDPADAARVFDETRTAFRRFMDNARKMVEVPMSMSQQVSFITAVLSPMPVAEVTKAETERVQATVAFRTMMHLLTDGAGAQLRTAAGTLWGALNAISEYTDHFAATRNDDNRFMSAQFGPKADVKAKALQMAETLAAAY